MGWPDHGNGPGVFRSGESAETTVYLNKKYIIDFEAGTEGLGAILIWLAKAWNAFSAGIIAPGWIDEGGLTPIYDQVHLTLDEGAAIVTKIRSGITECFTAGVRLWKNADGTEWFVTLSELLGEGSYGNSLVPFTRLTDGRVYEQIREVFDVVQGLSIPAAVTVYQSPSAMHGGNWPSPFVASTPDGSHDLHEDSPLLLETRTNPGTPEYFCFRSGGDGNFDHALHFSDPGWAVIPSRFSERLDYYCYTHLEAETPGDPFDSTLFYNYATLVLRDSVNDYYIGISEPGSHRDLRGLKATYGTIWVANQMTSADPFQNVNPPYNFAVGDGKIDFEAAWWEQDDSTWFWKS